MDILFAGLGRMGWPMAGYLVKAGHQVHVFNRTAEKAQRWVDAHGGAVHKSGDLYDAIILCVDKDEDVEALLTGPQDFLSSLREGGFVLDHTTTSINLARRMAEAALNVGRRFYDCPVSGGQAGAEKGQLSCMVGGDAASFAKVREILSAYCKKVVLIGDAGAGQAAKMANQLCIAGTLAGLSEAVRLLEHEPGFDADAVFEAISGGAAQSWQMDNRFKTMVKGEYDFGFGMDLMMKDLGYAIDRAREQGWSPDISEQIYQRFEILSKKAGMGRSDTSGLVEFYRKRKALG